jgi:pimeloyl-ACP methyl ester carboxylesterase
VIEQASGANRDGERMPQVQSNGITLEYERSGPADGAPLLLIHGVGAQLVRWPKSLCDALATAGFHLIRFDNRDVGLSTHMDGADVPDFAAMQAAVTHGETPDLPYTLTDMAADAAGLLDALGIAQAHVLGVSLGGMIAQVLAIDHPDRVRSLAIVMSQTGHSALPPSDPTALAALASPAPDPRVDEDEYLAHSIALNQMLGSPAYPADEAALADFARAAAARAYDPAGAGRQLAAARGGPDRRAALRQLDMPTLVIHGADDPLVKLAGGQDIAAHIPKAWLLTIHGMGHDLPDELADILASAVGANTRRAKAD